MVLGVKARGLTIGLRSFQTKSGGRSWPKRRQSSTASVPKVSRDSSAPWPNRCSTATLRPEPRFGAEPRYRSGTCNKSLCVDRPKSRHEVSRAIRPKRGLKARYCAPCPFGQPKRDLMTKIPQHSLSSVSVWRLRSRPERSSRPNTTS